MDRSPRGMSHSSAPFYNGTEASEVVTFAAGATTGKLRVATKNDHINEADGAMTMSVVAGSGYYVGTQSRRVITITDDDDVTISIAAVRSTITEGGDAQFEITASGRSQEALVIKLAINDGNGDFITGRAPSSVTLPARALTATVDVPTTNDLVDEVDGEIRATLVADEFYTVLAPNDPAMVAVTDNDLPLALTVEPVAEIVRKGQTAEFSLTLANSGVAQPVIINIAETGSVIAGNEAGTTFKMINGNEIIPVTTKTDLPTGTTGTITFTATIFDGGGDTPVTTSVQVTDSGASGASGANGANSGPDLAFYRDPLLNKYESANREDGLMYLPITLSEPLTTPQSITLTFKTEKGQHDRLSAVNGLTVVSGPANADPKLIYYEKEVQIPITAETIPNVYQIVIPLVDNSDYQQIQEIDITFTHKNNIHEYKFYIYDEPNGEDVPVISFDTITTADRARQEGQTFNVPIKSTAAPWTATTITFEVTTKSMTSDYVDLTENFTVELDPGDTRAILKIPVETDFPTNLDEDDDEVYIKIKDYGQLNSNDYDNQYKVATDAMTGQNVSETYTAKDHEDHIPIYEFCESADETVMVQEGGEFTYTLCTHNAILSTRLVDFKIDVKLGDLTDNQYMTPKNFFEEAQFETDSDTTINAMAQPTYPRQEGNKNHYAQELTLNLEEDQIDQGVNVVINLQLKADPTGQNYNVPKKMTLFHLFIKIMIRQRLRCLEPEAPMKNQMKSWCCLQHEQIKSLLTQPWFLIKLIAGLILLI